MEVWVRNGREGADVLSEMIGVISFPCLLLLMVSSRRSSSLSDNTLLSEDLRLSLGQGLDLGLAVGDRRTDRWMSELLLKSSWLPTDRLDSPSIEIPLRAGEVDILAL